MNFYKCGDKHLTKYDYLFVDTTDFEIAKIIQKYDKNCWKYAEIIPPDDNYVILVHCRIKKKDKDSFEQTIFPELHRVLLIKYGERYTKICDILEAIVASSKEKRLGREGGT